MHSFMAKWSPALAISIAWRVIASPSPSMSSSQARVTLFRLPSGRPLLERLPTADGLPRLPVVSMEYLCGDELGAMAPDRDRKSTRLNSSHLVISYAVFCLKKQKDREQPGDGMAPARQSPGLYPTQLLH